jgi:hypothetical protein
VASPFLMSEIDEGGWSASRASAAFPLLDRKARGHLSWSGRCEEEKNLISQPGIDPSVV